MAQTEVDVVRNNYEAYASGDYPAALALHHPEVEFDTRNRPDGHVWRGHEGLAAADRQWRSMWVDHRTDVREIRAVGGGHVLVVGELIGTARLSGIRVSWPLIALHRVEDGVIVWTAFFNDVDEALAAAGSPSRPRRA